MIQRLIPVAAICCCVAFAQAASNPNSVIVTASRGMNIQPDQVVFSVVVDTPTAGTLDQAVNTLQGSGITAANFTGVGTVQVYDPASGPNQPALSVLAWYFSLTVPLANLQSTVGLLSAVQKSNGGQNNGISISFSISGTSVSAQAALAQQCSQTGLLSDARAQAQALASAAGKTLGAVLAMSSGISTTPASGLSGAAVSTPSCTLTVKFQMSAGI